MISIFMVTLLGKDFQLIAEQELNLGSIVSTEVCVLLKRHELKWCRCFIEINCFAIILICVCPPIIKMAYTLLPSSYPAPGSAEVFSMAENAISCASKSGCWMFLKKMHNILQWLVMLEKEFLSITPHVNIRLFLTIEINPKLRGKIVLSIFNYNFFCCF